MFENYLINICKYSENIYINTKIFLKKIENYKNIRIRTIEKEKKIFYLKLRGKWNIIIGILYSYQRLFRFSGNEI